MQRQPEMKFIGYKSDEPVIMLKISISVWSSDTKTNVKRQVSGMMHAC